MIFEEYFEKNKIDLLLRYMVKYNFSFLSEIHNSLKNNENYTVYYSHFVRYARDVFDRTEILKHE